VSERSGRGNKLTGQLGEYLVAAELARQGLISTTFTGNVPHYDIIAADAKGRHVSVQVKASNSSNWQFSMDKFCAVTIDKGRQTLGRRISQPVRRLVVVFVQLGADRTKDRYFILKWSVLQGIMIRKHRAWLSTHGGRRPNNPNSLHVAIKGKLLAPYSEKWGTIRASLR
jgi:hypothetical protein